MPHFPFCGRRPWEGIFFCLPLLRVAVVLWYNVVMNKGNLSNAPCAKSAVDELAESLVDAVRSRCAASRMTVTLWLLFDTATGRNPTARDNALRDFKRYAKRVNCPRSVAEGSRWLAAHLKEYAA